MNDTGTSGFDLARRAQSILPGRLLARTLCTLNLAYSDRFIQRQLPDFGDR